MHHQHSTAAPRAGHERALVLGGGGSTGNAWLIGVLAGLADAGLDVTSADLVVGTSAGATAAAQLAGERLPDLLDAALTPVAAVPSHARRADRGFVAGHLARVDAVIASATDAADYRRRMGAAAIERGDGPGGPASARWRAVVAARLPRARWDATLRITAVAARTGEAVVFDRTSGVDLVDAVAASCAGGPAYWLDGTPYVDGGYRSVENADLASGSARVLVLAPLGGRTRTPGSWGTALAPQVRSLRAAGSEVAVVVPGEGDAHLFGANAMDVTLRPAAARAGYDQGTGLAESLAGLWG